MSRDEVKMSRACLSSVAGYLVEVELAHCGHVPSRIIVRNLYDKDLQSLKKSKIFI